MHTNKTPQIIPAKCGKVHHITGHEGPGGGGVGIQPYSFLNFDARCEWVVNDTPRSLYPQERPGSYYMGGWLGPRTPLGGCEKSRPPPPPTGIRFPERPAHTESLYRLSYHGPFIRVKYKTHVGTFQKESEHSAEHTHTVRRVHFQVFTNTLEHNT